MRFPAICGRVCTAPCEDVCRRGEFDTPIAIGDLKRFATDHGTPIRRTFHVPRNSYSERVAIVGQDPLGSAPPPTLPAGAIVWPSLMLCPLRGA
jgi:NADH-quinone oxidoreductase subunit F